MVFAGCGTRLPQTAIRAAAAGNTAIGTGLSDESARGSGPPDGSSAHAQANTGLTSGTSGGGLSDQGAAPAATAVTSVSGSSTGSVSHGSDPSSATGAGTSSAPTNSSHTPAGAGAAPGPATPSVANGSTVVVGNVGDYSGVLGALLGPAQGGLEVWAKYTNAHGGLNGHPVQVIIADSGGDPSLDQTDVEQMVQQDHAIAMVGDMDILDTTGNQQYLISRGMPVVGGDLAGNIYFTSPNYFPEGASFTTLAPVGITAAIREGKKNVGMVYCVETPFCEAGVSGLPAAVASAGGRLTYDAAASLTSPSFTSQCLGAQSEGVQVLELLLDAASITRFAEDCAAQGYNPLYETVSLGAVPSLDSVPQLNGLILPTSTFPFVSGSSPATSAFQTAMSDYDPSQPAGPAASIEWTSGQLVAAGAGQMGPTPSSAELTAGLDALKNNTLNGLTVPLTFHAGSTATVPNCVFLQEIRDGTWIAPNGLSAVCT